MAHVILFSFELFNSLSENEVIASSVELFSLKPNCDVVGWLILAKKSENLTFTIFSNTFKK